MLDATKQKKVITDTGKKFEVDHESRSLKAKTELRKWLMDKVGQMDPMILDAYCAAGGMWKSVYNKTAKYVGLDIRQFNDERETVKCNNLRYLRQADLDQFDIFDLDAFGSPMNALIIICKRLKWTRTNKVGIVLTDNTGRNSAFNKTNRGLMNYLGVSWHMKTNVQGQERVTYIKMVLQKAAEEAGAKITDIKVFSKTKMPMTLYVAYTLEKV